MNVSIFSQMAYEYKSNWTLGENEPNTNPIKANFCIGSMVHRLELQDCVRKVDTLIRRP